ncbi:lipocalin/fatty acid-binding family protein [Henriciella litoralis]|uniref:hypothetical protein n=1 Tax=Henriciella litoralis TaxID=568102 RepID=UPI0009FF293E|nr:hypothetical protein [Henriciella litoralis]
MAISGNYKMVIKTPMGDQKGGMTMNREGDALTGEMSSPFGNTVIEDGKVNGNELTWKTKVSNPMPLTLEFTGTEDDGNISGKVKLGSFGVSTFSATPD